MKTLFTAFAAIAFSATSFANHLHSTDCPKDCAVKPTSVAPVAKSYDKKMTELQHVAENKSGMINYNKSMQAALSTINKQKHLDAIENIESENAYHQLMADMIQGLEEQKLADQIEDLSAAKRFENLMLSVFGENHS